jgi:8-oxo-dGTP diphosphatase
MSTLRAIGSENRNMSLGRRPGHQRTEQLPAVDRSDRREVLSPDRTPQVDVRVVLFTISDGRLLIALKHQGAGQALPRVSPSPDEGLDATGTRILADHVGIAERYLEQLYSISHRSDGVWTVTVTYLALALAIDGGPPPNSAAWFDAGRLPELNHVDRMIVDYALFRLRAKLGYTTIAFHLLPPSFTLSELQNVYEAVLNREVDKRNFRRRIHAAGVLEATGQTRREGSHRPARLYQFRAVHDAETYLTPAWATSADREAMSP